MAGINAGYTRRTELRCTLEEMADYGAVVLYEGEKIYVRQEDGTYAVKLGDGVTPLADLPYVVNYSDIKALKEGAEAAYALANTAAEAAERASGAAEAAVSSLDIGIFVSDGMLCIEYEEDEEK